MEASCLKTLASAITGHALDRPFCLQIACIPPTPTNALPCLVMKGSPVRVRASALPPSLGLGISFCGPVTSQVVGLVIPGPEVRSGGTATASIPRPTAGVELARVEV